MHVVVGLGNPGAAYFDTRHNVGFRVVAELARRSDARLRSYDATFVGAQTWIDRHPVLLVMPQTYMNRSGDVLQAVRAIAPITTLMVVHDDLDLECGRVRVRLGGGAGGHRGVQSILESFGPDCVRVKVGIGRPSAGQDAVAYVLSPILDAADRDRIATAIGRAADAVEGIIRDGLQPTMNHINARTSSTGAAPLTGRN